MSQPDLFTRAPRFDGADLTPEDHPRLAGQLAKVYAVIQSGQWYTVAQIAHLIQAPENSVQAQLRNLRKPRFGGHTVERMRFGALTVYRLVEG